jgi:hypothetical protein
VDVLHAVDDLPEVEPGLVLCDFLVLHALVEFAVPGQLHDHEDVV